MQKSMDIGISPIKPVPASTRRKSIVIFSLLALIACGGCRYHRHAVEAIALSQRHQQRDVLYYDTTWQLLQCHIGSITIQKTPAMMGKDSTLSITSLSDVEVTLERQAKTEARIHSIQEDTVVFNCLEKTENVSGWTNPNPQPKRNRFLWGMLFPLALIGLVLIVLMFVRPQGR